MGFQTVSRFLGGGLFQDLGCKSGGTTTKHFPKQSTRRLRLTDEQILSHSSQGILREYVMIADNSPLSSGSSSFLVGVCFLNPMAPEVNPSEPQAPQHGERLPPLKP